MCEITFINHTAGHKHDICSGATNQMRFSKQPEGFRYFKRLVRFNNLKKMFLMCNSQSGY